MVIVYFFIAVTKNQHPSLTCGLWVLTGLLIFIIIEKVFSFEKDEDNVVLARDTKNLNISDNGSKSTTSSIRRKKSSFILNDLTVNYVTETNILKTITTNITNNNNDLVDKNISQLIKKPSNVHVSNFRLFVILPFM